MARCQVTKCQTTVGQTTVGQTTVGQTTVGQTTVGQTTVGQTTVGQTTVCQMTKCRMTRTVKAAVRTAVLGAVLTSGLTLGGADGASALQPKGPALCAYQGRPGPGYSLSIGNTTNGKTVCVAVGEKLLVSLSAPSSPGLKWSHIQVAPAGVLSTAAVTAAPVTAVPSDGVTAALFLAVHRGVVELTSQRHLCPPPANGTASCDAMLSWRATVVVRALVKPVPAATRAPVARSVH
jgi:hypothetical protein